MLNLYTLSRIVCRNSFKSKAFLLTNKIKYNITSQKSSNLQQKEFPSPQGSDNDHKNTEKKDVISHNDFLNLLDSIQNAKEVSKEKVFVIRTYLEANKILQKSRLNDVITKIFNINNPEIYNALEKSLGTKARASHWIQEQKEKENFDLFVEKRNKIKRLAWFNFRVFAVMFVITTLFRVYYYLEHDIDILEPRVSSYHIYRFR